MSASDSRTRPGVAVGLGYVAVAPFVVGAALSWTADAAWRQVAAQGLCAYAAVVISFIGAIHWGLAFPQRQPAARLFVWGVIPSIVAWVATLIPSRIGLGIDATILVACYLVDRVVYPKEGVATWLPLRLRLTVFAALSCIAGAAVR